MAIALVCPPTLGYTSSRLALVGLCASGSSIARCLIRLFRDTAQPGSVTLTDGQNTCSELDVRTFVRHRTSPWAGGDPSHVVQPGVRLLETPCDVWLSGIRREELNSAQSDVCAGKSLFRPSRLSSPQQGILVGRSLVPEAPAQSQFRFRIKKTEPDMSGDGSVIWFERLWPMPHNSGRIHVGRRL